MLTLVVTWLIMPFTMAALRVLFFQYLFALWVDPQSASEYIAGMILLGVAPCIAMVFVWSQLFKGDANYTLVQVCGGSQSFNAVNQMRVLGRWMWMVTLPNQSSVAKAFQEFDENDRMKPSPYIERIVDVMEEQVKFTWLTRDVSPCLVDRCSERKEAAEDLMKRVSQSAL
jgi:Sodium Bile acid symporter family